MARFSTTKLSEPAEAPAAAVTVAVNVVDVAAETVTVTLVSTEPPLRATTVSLAAVALKPVP